MADEAPGRTLQPTALVSEAYMRLMGSNRAQWANRRHFFSAAAEAMRRIRIDDARKRKRLKRGGGWDAVSLDAAPTVVGPDPAELLAVDEALDRLRQVDERKAEVVMLRYFTGLTAEESAEVLGVSQRTVESDWRFARIWLHRELSDGASTRASESSRDD